MRRANIGILTFNIFLLIGIIFSGIVTVMYLTGSINLQCFYDVGELYDIPNSNYRTSEEFWIYNFTSEKIEIETENASHVFLIENSRKDWNYVYLEVADLSKSSWWDIEFLDQNSQVKYTVSLPIQDGRNILQLQEGEVYAIRIIVREPSSFVIKKIQFREKLQNFEWKDAPKTFVMVMILYLLAILLLRGLVCFYRALGDTSIKKSVWIVEIQKVYEYLLDRGGEVFQGFSEKGKALLRRIFFLISVFIIYFMMIKGWNWKILIQRRQVIFLGICFLFVAFLSWEYKRKTINWKNPLVYSWFVLWIMTIISDFIVEKRVQNVGILMLATMAPLYMAWNSMKKPEKFLEDFFAALRWSYWIGCIFCIFCRVYVPGIRYSGIYKNPNIFARYLATVNIIFLTCLDENLRKEKVKYPMLVENILGLASIWGFLYLTESITSLIAYILQWVVFIWKQFPNEKKRAYWKNLKKMVLVFLCCIVFMVVPGKWCLTNVPQLFGTSVVFSGDFGQPVTGKMSLTLTSFAATTGITERLVQKITSGEWDFLFTGRDEVWKIYIRQWNLFGHERYLECIGEKEMHAHNALLQMMHYYGVFIAVPFLVMLYYNLKYSIQMIFGKNQMKMELFFLLAVVNYIVQGLTEDVATPYFYITWLTYYIAIGGVFCQFKNTET